MLECVAFTLYFDNVSDMIAIPDFAAGAMENWGLMIYRETAMLFKDGQSSESNRERIVQVIAHELAHMVCRSTLS